MAPDAGIPGADPGSHNVAAEGEESGRTTRRVRNFRACSGSSRTTNAVDRGLKYLKDAQNTEGWWTADPRAGTRPAVTGFALLSFLGAGETHKHGRYKKTVKAGLKYLKQIQDPSGCFGVPVDADRAANHAIATLAMCEAYDLTGSPLFKGSAQKGLDYMSRWNRSSRSVAFWELLALHFGARAGLKVPERTKRDAAEWLEWVTDERTGIASVSAGGVMPETVPGQTAAALLCRVLYGEDPKKSDSIRAAAKYLVARRPGTRAAKGDPGLLYFGTLAMFQCGGDAWKKWNEALKKHDFGTQLTKGKSAGSWNPEGRSGELLGRPGTTALRLMTRQVYYRYGRVFGTKR
jgi:hypothetical protein